MTTDHIAVVTTVGSEADARAMALAMVESRLVACAQISAIESVYRWDGAVQREPEWRVLFKTRRALWPQVEIAVRTRHRYELPAIHAFALEFVDAAYGAWLDENTAPP